MGELERTLKFVARCGEPDLHPREESDEAARGRERRDSNPRPPA
jgi:hypothetical protein